MTTSLVERLRLLATEDIVWEHPPFSARVDVADAADLIERLLDAVEPLLALIDSQADSQIGRAGVRVCDLPDLERVAEAVARD